LADWTHHRTRTRTRTTAHAYLTDTLYSADGTNSVHFEQLSDGLQEKIYDYLESLKLDHRLGTFIFEYTRNYHAHKSAQVLSDLKQFVSHLRDE